VIERGGKLVQFGAGVIADYATSHPVASRFSRCGVAEDSCKIVYINEVD